MRGCPPPAYAITMGAENHGVLPPTLSRDYDGNKESRELFLLVSCVYMGYRMYMGIKNVAADVLHRVTSSVSPCNDKTPTAPRERQHIICCEVENERGGREYFHIEESNVVRFWLTLPTGLKPSDEDHSMRCWCW